MVVENTGGAGLARDPVQQGAESGEQGDGAGFAVLRAGDSAGDGKGVAGGVDVRPAESSSLVTAHPGVGQEFDVVGGIGVVLAAEVGNNGGKLLAGGNSGFPADDTDALDGVGGIGEGDVFPESVGENLFERAKLVVEPLRGDTFGSGSFPPFDIGHGNAADGGGFQANPDVVESF